VGGQVIRPQVGLNLDQAAGQPAAVDGPDQELAEEVSGYVKCFAGKELEGEGGFDPPSLPAAARARRALWRRLSR
jgi:hypothetical protein